MYHLLGHPLLGTAAYIPCIPPPYIYIPLCNVSLSLYVYVSLSAPLCPVSAPHPKHILPSSIAANNGHWLRRRFSQYILAGLGNFDTAGHHTACVCFIWTQFNFSSCHPSPVVFSARTNVSLPTMGPANISLLHPRRVAKHQDPHLFML